VVHFFLIDYSLSIITDQVARICVFLLDLLFCKLFTSNCSSSIFIQNILIDLFCCTTYNANYDVKVKDMIESEFKSVRLRLMRNDFIRGKQ